MRNLPVPYIEEENFGYEPVDELFEKQQNHKDLVILDKWIEFEHDKKDHIAKCFSYLLKLREDDGPWETVVKVIKLCKVYNVPKELREKEALMVTQDELLTALWHSNISFITIYCNMPDGDEKDIKGFYYCYGVEEATVVPEESRKYGYSKDAPDKVKIQRVLAHTIERAEASFGGMLRLLRGNYRQSQFSMLTMHEAEAIRHTIEDAPEIQVIRGIPKTHISAASGVTTALTGVTTTPEGVEQNEEFIRAMLHDRYANVIMAKPIPHHQLLQWSENVARELSQYKSQYSGTRSFNAGISIPMVFAGNLSASTGNTLGVSETVSETDGTTEGLSDTSSRSVGTSNSESHNVGYSLGNSQGMANSISDSQTYSDSSGLSDGISDTTSTGTSHSVSNGVTDGVTDTHSIGKSHTVGNSETYAEGKSLTESQSHSVGQSITRGHTVGETYGYTVGDSFSRSQSESQGVNHGWSLTNGETQGITTGHTVGHTVGDTTGTTTGHSVSQTNTTGTTFGHTEGTTNTHSVGQSSTVSNGTSSTHSTGTSSGTSSSVGQSFNQGQTFGQSQTVGDSVGHSVSNGTSSGTSVGYADGYSNSITGTHMDGNTLSTGNGWNIGVNGGTPVIGGSAGWSGQNTIGATSSDSIARAHADNHSDSFSATNSTSHGESDSTSHSVSNGLTNSQSYSQGTSTSQGVSNSVSNTNSTGTSSSVSHGNSISDSVGKSVSDSVSKSFSTSVGTSDSVSNSNSHSVSNSISDSTSNSLSNSLSRGQTVGTSTGISNGLSSGHSTSNSHSLSNSYSESIGRSESYGESVSRGQTWSHSLGKTISDGVSESNSHGLSHSVSKSASDGVSSSHSLGHSVGRTHSISNGLSHGVGRTQNVGVSQSLTDGHGVSRGTTIGDSRGFGHTTGTSHGLSQGTGTTHGRSTATGVGQGLNFSFGPSIGVSRGYAVYDEEKGNLMKLLENQNTRFNLAVRMGAFYVDAYIATYTSAGRIGAALGAKTSWGGDNEISALQCVHPNSKFIEEHLLKHLSVFQPCSMKEYIPNIAEGYLWSTIMLTSELAALTHLPRVETGGMSTVATNIPAFSVFANKRGEIYLGKQINYEDGQPNYDYFFSKNEFMHTLIAGASGCGKTTSAVRIAREVIRNYKDFKIFVLDWKKSWRVLKNFADDFEQDFDFYGLDYTSIRPIKMNVYVPPKYIGISQWCGLMHETLCLGYGFGNKMFSVLQRAARLLFLLFKVLELDENGIPRENNESHKNIWKVTLDKVYLIVNAMKAGQDPSKDNNKLYDWYKQAFNALDDPYTKAMITAEFKEAGRGMQDAFDSIVAKLAPYYSGELKELYCCTDPEQSARIEDLVDGKRIVVLEGGSLDSNSKKFVCQMIATGIFNYCSAKKNIEQRVDKRLVILEEAHRIIENPEGGDGNALNVTEDIFNIIFNEGREFGLYATAIVQAPSELPPAVVTNCSILIVHRLGNKEDIDMMVTDLCRNGRLDNRDMPIWIAKQPIGQAIVRINNTATHHESEPVLIQVARCENEPPDNEELVTEMGLDIPRSMIRQAESAEQYLNTEDLEYWIDANLEQIDRQRRMSS